MKAIRAAARLAAALLAAAVTLAQAGGPLEVCSSQPLKYQNAGNVVLNYDGGGRLGSRSKAQADAIVTSAIGLWTNIPTSTLSITRGSDLPVDVTAANYSAYLSNFSDGLNPVVYDTDGSIVDTLLGVGARNSVLGFAGSAWYGAPTCRYAEGRAVINGYLNVGDSTMTVVMAHEIGHLVGLDHTQLDSSQGLASAAYPLMYPIAYRSSISLHEDDVAAASALYPDASVDSAYGQLTGSFKMADGVTAVRGANIWAREKTTGRIYSSVSDYLMQGTGYFRLLLAPGTYTLHAEAIAADFNGGSSVGPYSESYPGGVSFQPPLYSSGNPMAPIAMSEQVPITAGCVATTTFRLDGAGTVAGNCGATTGVSAATMTSPANGATLSGASQIFQWTSTGAVSYQVWVGNSAGAHDLAVAPAAGTSGTTVTISGLPTDGRRLYVRLHSLINGAYQHRDYVYTAASSAATPRPASLTSPWPGARLSSGTQTFQWSDAGASYYQLWLGSTSGGYDLGYSSASPALSATMTGLPTDGRTIYARLYSSIGGVYYYTDASYIAAGAATPAPPPATGASITNPAPGSRLSGSSQLFQWNDAGASYYQLWLGSTFGGYDLGYSAASSALSATLGGLPTDGRKIYARLYSNIGGVYRYTDATYTAASPAVTGAVVSNPGNGSTLSGPSQLFQWNNVGASHYELRLGSNPGGEDLGRSAASSALSATMTGLPTDGRAIYARLYSTIGGAAYYSDTSYRAATASPTGAVVTNPASGGTLAGSSQLFQWNDAGAAFYQLWLGSAAGGYDLGYSAASSALSATMTGLPTDGRTIHARLYSSIGGVYYYTDTSYRAAGAAAPATGAAITSPSPGSRLSGSSQLFQWNDAGATFYQLWAGTTPGGYDLGYSPASSALSATMNGLPTNGRAVYVRLYSNIGGVYHYRDFAYATGP